MSRYVSKRYIALLTVALIVFCATACSGANESADIDAEKELNIGFANLPITMDAQMAFDSASTDYLRPMISTLFKDVNGEIKEDLAAGYEASEDGLIYTIKLRDDIKYSDGTPITAEDFVYAFQRIADPLSGSSAIFVFHDICEVKNIQAVNEGQLPLSELGVSAPDDRTLVIELERPCPYFISTLATSCSAPCSRSFVEKCGSLYATKAEYILGSGPFYIDRYEPFDTQVHYSKNPYYYDSEAVQLSGISIRYVQSGQQAMMCYESGALDVINLSGSIQELAEDDENVTENASGSIFYMGTVPAHNSALKNKNIRRALIKSINRESIVRNITKRGTAPLERFVPENFSLDTNGNDYVKEPGEYSDVCAYDKEKALEYWQQGLDEINTKALELSLICRPNDETVIEMIINEWENNLPGLSIDAKVIPAKQYWDELDKKENDLYVAGWGADYSDPNTFLSLFISTSKYDYADLKSEKYDKLLDDAVIETDPTRRFEMLHEAEDLLMEESLYFPIYAKGDAWLISGGVKDVVFNFNGSTLDPTWVSKNR
ncbi:peptide ABC transporter substrate-binding protein [Butyrivibrio sp. WCD2001]|uniref:peptide ABC transporter substrate-binding protein n=1 Tax=Butyrivibrio sp. WCD2001 TaxID=1280681 RepID=UPI0003F81A25|nr:peptide ABC transporter substrate-binding protein [Butyrivibrio sp. WCD2001]